MYTIYMNNRRVGTARNLEAAVRTGGYYAKIGEVLIETPSGHFSTIAELQKFIDSEALFLVNWN